MHRLIISSVISRWRNGNFGGMGIFGRNGTRRAVLNLGPPTVVYREIETAVPDERILVLFVPYILLTRSYNIKVNIFGLNEVKIEIDSPGAAL